ncbi:MAG TPA: HYR domain-containing protein [Blastocatellia bacterium]|nr:HYR domain-containing protein [Blastocatellia bacterium]
MSLFVLNGHRLARAGRVSANTESIALYAGDCTTGKSVFNLGDSVCAIVSGVQANERRFAWASPDGSIYQLGPTITTDPQSSTITIPTSGFFSQVGTWTVRTLDFRGSGFDVASFVVRDPSRASADVGVNIFGTVNITAGNNIVYRVEVTNNGPDAADNIVVTQAVPANTSWVSESQDSGPAATCTNPSPGATTGTSTCTIPTLAAGSTAVFTYTYQVSGAAANGSTITCSASATTSTNELHQADNSTSLDTLVANNGTAADCTINCPADISQNAAAGMCSAVVTYTTPTASGACADPDTGNTPPVVCTPPSNSSFPIGSTTVICASGGTNCAFTVTVVDTSAPSTPTINCPSNLTVDEESEGAGFAKVNYSTPTTTGNCVTVTCDPPAGATFLIGTTTVSCTGTDSSHNTVSCSFTVTVRGSNSAGCTVTCPGDVTQTAAAGVCNAVVNYPAPATSGTCGTVTCSPASGTVFAAGVTVVTCTSSQGGSCDFTVTVVPAAPPTITTCATDKTVTASAICEATIPNLVSEVVATGCGVTVSQSPAAGSIVGPGIYTVTITAENGAGETPCTAKVTVVNSITSTITCTSDITTANDQDQCGAVVNYPAPTADNSCSTLTVACSPASGSFFPIGATNVLCTATDLSGATTTCTFRVTVNDTQLPTIACPANITHANDSDKCGAVINYASPATADNCPGVTTSCSPAAGTQFSVGTTTVICTVTDAANNTATCSFTVTVSDNQPPAITCPSPIAVGTDPNVATATVTYTPTVSDNCSGVGAAVCSPASGTHFPVGATAVSCTVTDAANNTATCSFTVTVSDNQPPAITCPPSLTRPNTANQCAAVVTYANPTVTDNQPGPTFVCSPASGASFPVGVTNVTCTATDASNNHSTCSFSVTVADTQAPVITCPANITASNTLGQCSAIVNTGAATATDNCPGTTVVGVRSDGLALNAAYPVGTTTIVWTARDAAGNQVSCTQTVVVNDTQAPTISGAAANPSSLWPPNHKMVDVTISYGVADNCTPTSSVTCDLTVTSNEPPSPPGDGHNSAEWKVIDAHHVQLQSERSGNGNGRVYTITIRCTDSHGNVATQTVTVTVPHDQGH